MFFWFFRLINGSTDTYNRLVTMEHYCVIKVGYRVGVYSNHACIQLKQYSLH